MAITKVTRTLLSTGIVDNSNATAITIDSSENVGIGNTQATAINNASGLGNLVVGSGSGAEGITIYSGSDSYGGLNFADATSGGGSYVGYIKFNHVDNSFGHFIGNTERMRIDSSGNVGIGTDNPSGGAVGGKVLHLVNSGGTASVRVDRSDASTTGTLSITSGNSTQGLYGTGSKPMVFSTNSVERMRIDSSGSLLVNTTSAGSNRLKIVGDASRYGILSENLSGYGAFNLKSTTVAQTWSIGAVDNSSNSDLFIYGGSSAGTKVTLDSSGNVGIGVTNPSAYYAENLVVGAADEGGITISCGSTEKAYLMFADGTTGSTAYRGYIGYDHSNDSMNFASHNYMNFYSAGLERMRIDSNGNIAIGGTSASNFSGYVTLDLRDTTGGLIDFSEAGAGVFARIQAVVNNSLNINNRQAYPVTFGTNDTERMRIDSSGNLLVGKTSASLEAVGHWFRGNGESFHTIANTDNTLHIYDTTNNAYRFYVSGGGTISATSTSITGLSDERLKENITDLETGLSEVMSLKPRRFDWKENEGSNEKNVSGFIAQEVEAVLPDLVGDFKHEELEDAKAIKMGDMIPTLVKAIQELSDKVDNQQTIIDDLKTRIETLENV
jgi:hypothetical protein